MTSRQWSFIAVWSAFFVPYQDQFKGKKTYMSVPALVRVLYSFGCEDTALDGDLDRDSA